MRKKIILTLLLIIALVSPIVLAADIIDYREFKFAPNNTSKIEKPTANFGIKVKDSNGNILAKAETETNSDNVNTTAPLINAEVGDTLVFYDNSISRYNIATWDWQYYTEDGSIAEIKSIMDEELKLTAAGTYHFYLAVADNAAVTVSDNWFWDKNWSDNGNHCDIKDLGGGFQGLWYFNEIQVNVAEKPGVDLEIDVYPAKSPVELSWMEESELQTYAGVCIHRLDDGADTITAEVTLVSPSGTSTKTVTFVPGENRYADAEMSYWTSKAGNYTFSASVVPINIEDTDTSNNWDSCTVTVVKQQEPKRKDSDSGLRGGLTG